MTNEILKQLDDLIIITLNEITKKHNITSFKTLKDMIDLRSNLESSSNNQIEQKLSEQEFSIIKDFIRNCK
jgi:hypothetical protein